MEFIDLKSQYRALGHAIDARIKVVLDHGQYIMGPEVKEMEARLAAYTGARHCISVASGTEALLIALMAIGVRPGDEIITTPFSFVATAEMIVMLGARPVFVDVQADTCNIDPSLIAARITERTRAILPVSLYGQPSDMDEINAIAARHKLPVIEDAAQSFGATYKGRRSGNLSGIGCTSFFPSKPLGCYGDGGALFTNDDGLAQAMREIRVHGQPSRYVHTRVGVGGRMDTLQCAIVLAKLERFDWEMEQRARIGARYHQALSGKVETVSQRGDRSSSFAQFTVKVGERARVQDSLRSSGVPTAVHYPLPIHQQPAYAHLCCPDCCPVSVALSQVVMSLPMSADLDELAQDKVVAELIRACAASA